MDIDYDMLKVDSAMWTCDSCGVIFMHGATQHKTYMEYCPYCGVKDTKDNRIRLAYIDCRDCKHSEFVYYYTHEDGHYLCCMGEKIKTDDYNGSPHNYGCVKFEEDK